MPLTTLYMQEEQYGALQSQTIATDPILITVTVTVHSITSPCTSDGYNQACAILSTFFVSYVAQDLTNVLC